MVVGNYLVRGAEKEKEFLKRVKKANETYETLSTEPNRHYGSSRRRERERSREVIQKINVQKCPKSGEGNGNQIQEDQKILKKMNLKNTHQDTL